MGALSRLGMDGSAIERSTRRAAVVLSAACVVFVGMAALVYATNAPLVGSASSTSVQSIPSELFQDQMRKTQLAQQSKEIVNAGSMSSPVKAITISIPKKSQNLEKVVKEMDGLKNSVARLNEVLKSSGTDSESADSIQRQASSLQETLRKVQKSTSGGASQIMQSIADTASSIKNKNA